VRAQHTFRRHNAAAARVAAPVPEGGASARAAFTKAAQTNGGGAKKKKISKEKSLRFDPCERLQSAPKRGARDCVGQKRSVLQLYR